MDIKIQILSTDGTTVIEDSLSDYQGLLPLAIASQLFANGNLTNDGKTYLLAEVHYYKIDNEAIEFPSSLLAGVTGASGVTGYSGY